MFQRRAGDRPEARVVDPLQARLVDEIAGHVQQFQVAFAGRADHELGHRRRPAALQVFAGRPFASNGLDPLQRGQQFLHKTLLGSQQRQALRRGSFQIDRQPVGQLHGPVDLVVLGAGHDLQVHIAPETMPFAQDGDGVQQFVLRAHAAADDAAAEKQAFDRPGAMHVHENAGHFVGLEGRAAGAAPGPEGAIVAVALAGGGQHRLQQGHGAAVGQGHARHTKGVACAGRGGSCACLRPVRPFETRPVFAQRAAGKHLAARGDGRGPPAGRRLLGRFQVHMNGDFAEFDEGVHGDRIEQMFRNVK